MTPQEAYADWAATYDADRNLTRDLDARVTQQVLGKRRYRSILEIGCGTGKNTQLLAEIGERVLAIDFSPRMLAKAKHKVKRDNVAFAIADLRAPWPMTKSGADLVSCNLVLEHVQHLAFVFAEAARALAAGGHFFVCELHPYRQYQGTQARFERENVTIGIQSFVHHISDYLSAAWENGFAMECFQEWWDESNEREIPRLASFLFRK